MLQGWQKRWNVSGKKLLLILCVFAITGFATAYLSRVCTAWAGFTKETHWTWKLLLRFGVLLFGYQVILLIVAALFGQGPFFWNYEKRLLGRLRLLKKEENIRGAKKQKKEFDGNEPFKS